ncbi:MAG TPA: hypothetical protein VFX49_03265, partial [Chloroflexota bacterium]|nr:hypothetical protein [Chloroflexota bacterium]
SQFGHLPFSTMFLGEEATLAIGHGTAVLYDAGNERDGGRELKMEDLPAPAEEENLPKHLIARLEKGEQAVESAGIRHHRDVAEILDAGLRSVRSQAVVRLPLPLPLMQAADY